MQNLINFKKSEVVASNKEEAFDQVSFKIIGDATQAYKNWVQKQTHTITEPMLKEFYIEQLKKKTKLIEGVGLAICIETPIKNTRERPYKIENVKNEKGKRKYKSVYQIKNKEGVIVGETSETQAKAKEITRELYTTQNIREDLICTYSKQIIEGEPVAFIAHYTPSKGTKSGRWILFGVEA